MSQKTDNPANKWHKQREHQRLIAEEIERRKEERRRKK